MELVRKNQDCIPGAKGYGAGCQLYLPLASKDEDFMFPRMGVPRRVAAGSNLELPHRKGGRSFAMRDEFPNGAALGSILLH